MGTEQQKHRDRGKNPSPLPSQREHAPSSCTEDALLPPWARDASSSTMALGCTRSRLFWLELVPCNISRGLAATTYPKLSPLRGHTGGPPGVCIPKDPPRQADLTERCPWSTRSEKAPCRVHQGTASTRLLTGSPPRNLQFSWKKPTHEMVFTETETRCKN